MGPGVTRSSDIFSPGTSPPDCADDGLPSVSLVGDAHETRKKEMSKTTALRSAVCLITDANLGAGHLRCNQQRNTAVTECRHGPNHAPPNSEVTRATPRLAIGGKCRTCEVGLNSCHLRFSVPFRHDPILGV